MEETNNLNDIISKFDEETDHGLKINLELIPMIPDCIIVKLNGYLDVYNSDYFQRCIGKVVGQGYIKLIFHCSKLNYLESSGIRAFFDLIQSVKPKGGNILFYSLQPMVSEVMKLLGYFNYFNTFENLDDAIVVFDTKSVIPKKEKFPSILRCPNCKIKIKVIKAGRFRCSECKKKNL